MTGDPMAALDLVVAATVFVLTLSLWIGGVLLWAGRRLAGRRRIAERLRLDERQRRQARVLRLWHQGRPAVTTVTVVSEARSLLRSLDDYTRRAGWPFGAGAMILLVGGIVVITSVFAGFAAGNAMLAAMVALALVVIARIVLSGCVARRDRLLEQQLIEALELAARSLRAGHPLVSAFQLVSEEMAQPVSTVFGELCQRHEMGADMGDALRQAARAGPSQDMRMFAASVAIQMRTGGNLADLMDRLASVIRERMRLGRRVKVLTAQAQLSKRVLIGLPIILFVLLNAINADYMRPLYTTMTGGIMLGIAAGGLALGALVMNAMSELRY